MGEALPTVWPWLSGWLWALALALSGSRCERAGLAPGVLGPPWAW